MKKSYSKSLIAGAILASFTQMAMADSLGPIPAVQDTWTNGSAKGSGSNYGDANTLRIDTGKNRAFIQFTVSGIPAGHTVETATLTLTANAINVNTYSIPDTIPDTFIAPIVGVDWVEGDLTDLTDDALLAAVGDTIASATDIPVGSAVDFNITDGITGNGTYTFLINIANKDARAVKYDSSTPAIAANAPKLTITTVSSAPVDTAEPVFADVIAPIEINATDTLTDISKLINITANDETDGAVTATVISDSTLVSGTHTVTLQATDVAGNISDPKEVTVNITPLIEITAPDIFLAPVGGSATVAVGLSGPAVAWPVTVDYTVTGDAATGTTASLTFEQINHPEVKDVIIDIAADAIIDQSAILTLTTVDNVQSTSETVTFTVAGNIAPTVTLSLVQAGATIATISSSNAEGNHYIDGTKGPVTISANVSDLNGDAYTLDWTGSSADLGANGESFVFSTEQLSGGFTLTATATEDSTVDKLSTMLQTKITVIATALPALDPVEDTDGDGIPDSAEGYQDSDGDGIVDYLDSNSDTTELPLSDGQAPLKTQAGLTLSLGSFISAAQGIEADSAIISQDNLNSTAAVGSADTLDTGYAAIEGSSIINFRVSGLDEGASVSVVYPLPETVVLTDSTQYRKYTPTVGWTTFVSDADNQIASAAKDDAGNCPAPNDPSYTDGLTAGASCIQLTILDGGIYDADGSVNGSIEDPAILAEASSAPAWSADTIEFNVNENSGATVTIDLTTYASDAEGDPLTFAKDSGPAWLTLDGAGVLSADLSGVASGEYSATVSVSDTKAQTTVNLTVAVNKAPVLGTVELAPAARNVAYSASIADLVTDAEGDAYTINKVSGPYWLSVSEAGELSGTPLHADIGESTIGIELVDAKGAKTTTTFKITVADSDVRASKGGALSGALLAMLGLVALRRRKKK